MNEDKPNEKHKLALERGKKILESMARDNKNKVNSVEFNRIKNNL